MSFVDFPDSSKIWIYLSNRAFTRKDEVWLNEHLEKFTAEWKAHGVPLNASFEIAYHQIIILAVNEDIETPSGCSIDTSVHAIQEAEKYLGVQLFARLNIALLQNGELQVADRITFSELYATHHVNENNLMLDNTLNSLGKWREEWIKPIIESWAKSWIPQMI
jgi:hypothetical protein